MGNDLLDLTSEDLCHFTRQFSPENLIGVTHLGKLYRGKMPVDSDATKDVAVKILGHDERLFKYIGDDKLQRLEVCLCVCLCFYVRACSFTCLCFLCLCLPRKVVV